MPDCLPALPRGPGGPGFPRPLQIPARSRRGGAFNGCVGRTGPGQLAARAVRVFSLAGASLLLSGLLAAPVQAQSRQAATGFVQDSPVLVTNSKSKGGGAYDPYSGTILLLRKTGQHTEQSFTTGSHPEGYRVGKWRLLIQTFNTYNFSSWISQGARKVYTHDVSNFSDTLGICTPNPTCILSLFPQQAQKGRNLQPSTTYRVGFRPTRRAMKIYLRNSDDESDFPGWSIANSIDGSDKSIYLVVEGAPILGAPRSFQELYTTPTTMWDYSGLMSSTLPLAKSRSI